MHPHQASSIATIGPSRAGVQPFLVCYNHLRSFLSDCRLGQLPLFTAEAQPFLFFYSLKFGISNHQFSCLERSTKEQHLALTACAAHMREVINAAYSVQHRNQHQLNKGQVCYYVRHKAMRDHDSLSGHVLFVPASSQFWALEAHAYYVTTHMIAERFVAVQVRNTRP